MTEPIINLKLTDDEVYPHYPRVILYQGFGNIEQGELAKNKIEKALEHYEACDTLVLIGKDAEEFIEYDDRKLTQEEKDSLEEASKYFEEHDVETIENKRNREIAERLQSKIKNLQDQIEVAMREDIYDIEEFKLRERLRDLMEIRGTG